MSRPMELTKEQIALMLASGDPDTATLIRARLNLIESLEALTGELRKIGEAMHEMTEAATRMSEALDRSKTRQV